MACLFNQASAEIIVFIIVFQKKHVEWIIQNSHGKSLLIEITNGQYWWEQMMTDCNRSRRFMNTWLVFIYEKHPLAEELSLKAVACLGLNIAGVDTLFKDENSFVICEQSPDWPLILAHNPILNCVKIMQKFKTFNNSVQMLGPEKAHFHLTHRVLQLLRLSS